MKKIFICFLILILLTGCMNKFIDKNKLTKNDTEKKERVDFIIKDRDFIYSTTTDENNKVATNLFTTRKRRDCGQFEIYQYIIMPHSKTYQLQLELKLSSVQSEDKEISKCILSIPATKKEQKLIIGYDKFNVRFGLIENNQVSNKANFDLNKFVGYTIKTPGYRKKLFMILK